MPGSRSAHKVSSRKPSKSKTLKSAKYYCSSSNGEDVNDSNSDINPSSPVIHPVPIAGTVNMDLKKEYCRYCKLYSSEPLEFVAGPLEKATLCQGTGQVSGIGGVLVDLKGRGLRGVDCIALGKILGSNANVHHLNMSDCLLLPQGFQALLDGISKNANIEVLELRGNNIHSANMLEPLGAMLKINSNLKRLILEWNHMGTNRQAFQSFCDGIAINTGLEHLDLRNNQISDECTLELAGALKHNKTMKDVDLRWNSIGVVGARAFYDLLSTNKTLIYVQLSGNFVPEEIVQHIEQMLKQRSQQEEIVKDYSTRTIILTRQLQKTEEEYQTEIKNIMSIFDSEEKEYRKIIEENQNQISRIAQECQDEITRNSSLKCVINSLKRQLAEASEEQEKLRELVAKKEHRASELENTFKFQTGSLEHNFEEKLQSLQQLTDSLSKEKTTLITQARTAEAELQVKTGEVTQLKETIQSLNKASEQLHQQFDDRLRQAKESWTGFQSEIESAERKEIQRLETQMKEMNTSLMEHLKVLENKKADAEEEVRRLKMQLVTSRSETEEELTKLRATLAEEHNASMKSQAEQITSLRQENERLEVEINKLEGQVRKLEVENGKLSRQNDHLKQQLQQANDDLTEIHASSQTSMTRTRNDLKDATERLAKEEEANRHLRSQLNDFQQQVSGLSVRVTKLSQEKQADMEFWKLQIQRREDELSRLKSEDMRRAALLHEAFSVYMRSTSAATGIPIPLPTSCCHQDLPHSSPQNQCQSKTNLNVSLKVGEKVQSTADKDADVDTDKK